MWLPVHLDSIPTYRLYDESMTIGEVAAARFDLAIIGGGAAAFAAAA